MSMKQRLLLQLPIHAIIAKLLSALATGADCDRLFSVSGRFFCGLRARLTTGHVDIKTLFKSMAGG